MDWSQVQVIVLEPFRAMFTRIINFAPALLGAVIVLLIGWWLARRLQNGVVWLLNTLHLDDGLGRIGVTDVLRKGEVKYTVAELFGITIYWLVILSALLAALNVFGLTIAAELLERAIGYVPNVLAGVIILILGLFFSTMLGATVQTAAANAGIGQAKGLGQIVRMVVVIFASIVALDKFFSSVIIQTTFTIVIAAIAFGTALAFGLGCQSLAGRFASEFIDKVRRR